MKNITMIKIEGCPYCAKAFKAMTELTAGSEKYKNISVDVIDENLQPKLAAPYGKDYYYVPTFFVDGKKMFEAHPGDDYETIRAGVEKAFSEAVK